MDEDPVVLREQLAALERSLTDLPPHHGSGVRAEVEQRIVALRARLRAMPRRRAAAAAVASGVEHEIHAEVGIGGNGAADDAGRDDDAAVAGLSAITDAALDVVENMILITDASGRIVYVNPAFTAVTGYEAEEVLGRNPNVLQSGQQDDAFYARLWATILAGETWDGELVNRRKNGALYTDRMTISPLRGDDGEIRHFVAVKRDVSSHLAALTAGNPVGIAHTDPDGRLVYANDRLSRLLGRGFDELLGDGWFAALGRSASDQVRAVLPDALAGRVPVTVVEIADGRALRVSLAPLVFSSSTPAGVVATVEDVTSERETLRRVRDREEFARGILESLATPTAVVDAHGVIRSVNRAWRETAVDGGLDTATVGLGVDYRVVCRRSADNGDESARVVLDALDRVLAGNSTQETIDYRLDGQTPTWWEVRITPLEVADGGAVLVHSDITWRRTVQELLEERAETDALTGLWNRIGLLRHAESLRARVAATGHAATVGFVDLDRFKPVNDEWGHEAGDAVLREVATRLQSVVRTTDVVARVGGDEFVLVCEDVDAHALAGLEARVHEAVEAPIAIADDGAVEVTVGASIGWVPFAADADLAAVIAAADEQMFAVKRTRNSARSSERTS